MDVSAIDLRFPAWTDFDFSVAGRGAVTNDELVSQAVLHFTNVRVVVVEGFSVALACAAVVDDDIAPAAFCDRGAINFSADVAAEVFPAFEKAEEGRKRGGLNWGFLTNWWFYWGARFLDGDDW